MGSWLVHGSVIAYDCPLLVSLGGYRQLLQTFTSVHTMEVIYRPGESKEVPPSFISVAKAMLATSVQEVLK